MISDDTIEPPQPAGPLLRRNASALAPPVDWKRRSVVACAATALALAWPAAAGAQQQNEVVVGAGIGGTYYCIVTRCHTGTTVHGLVEYAPRPVVAFQVSARWHACFDCDRFIMTEGGVQLRYPGERVRPFAGLGAGYYSDSAFFGSEAGVHASVGTWYWPAEQWGGQLELRGRQFGVRDRVGELSVAAARRLR